MALEARRKPQRKITRGSDGVAGEQASEIDHVENVVQVLAVGLEAHGYAVRLIDFGSRGGIGLKRGQDAPAVEVDSADDLGAILRTAAHCIALILRIGEVAG